VDKLHLMLRSLAIKVGIGSKSSETTKNKFIEGLLRALVHVLALLCQAKRGAAAMVPRKALVLQRS